MTVVCFIKRDTTISFDNVHAYSYAYAYQVHASANIKETTPSTLFSTPYRVFY